MISLEGDWAALGREVQERRLELGMLSQKAAAERAGVHVNTWNKVENGHPIKPASLESMARVLQWHPSRIWGILRGSLLVEEGHAAASATVERDPASLPVDVRRRREERGLSQKGLALAADVSRGTIRNVEAGLRPFARTVERIDEAFARLDATAKAATLVTEGPALVFVATDGTQHAVDDEGWSLADLSSRDRVVFRALLAHVSARLDPAGPPDRQETL